VKRFFNAAKTLKWLCAGLALAVVLGFADGVFAQETTRVPVATSPGKGRFYFREVVSYVQMSDDPSPDLRTIEEMVALSRFSYGITGQLSANVNVPLIYSNERSPAASHHGAGKGVDEMGVGDISMDLKYRPFQWDLGPVDTLRLAFIGGIEVPTYDKHYSSDGFDPYFGVVFTGVMGRHGVNQSLRYKVNTNGSEYNMVPGDGSADALFYDTSYLFRLMPGEYTETTPGSLYFTVELNGIYEVNGDNEVLLGPGLLYEAAGFAVEFSAGLPVASDVSSRPRQDLVLSLGFRVLF
jgi:hypothetical protein